MADIVLSTAERLEAAYVAYAVRICQLVPTIVALYDHLITLDQEVELVWNKPWSIAKILFFWNRYFGTFFLLAEAIVFSMKPLSDELCVIIDLLSVPDANHWDLALLYIAVRLSHKTFLFADFLPFPGRNWFFVQGWSTAIIIWSMQSIMLFRTFAMYRRRRIVVIICVICYVGEVCSMVAILVNSFLYIDATSEPFPGVFICTATNVPRYMYALWLPVIILDCILFGLALWTGIWHVKSFYGLQLPRNPMWQVLLRDSLIYFSVTLTAYVASAVIWLILPAQWLKLPQGFSIAGTCVMGVRLILNLRKAYYVPWPSDDLELETMDLTVHIPSRALRNSLQIPTPSLTHSVQLQDVIFVKGDVLRRLSETLTRAERQARLTMEDNPRRGIL